MAEQLRYEANRSNSKLTLHVICYEDRFYNDLPHELVRRGPWYTLGRGAIVELKPEYRLALARNRYVVVEAEVGEFSLRAK